MLFAGPEGIGKSLFAQEMATKLLQAKSGRYLPDLHIYRPEGKIGMHSMESMRRFTEEVYLAPLEAVKKVFIIHDAERMLTYSANALLKTFEEPSKNSIIILVSSNPDKLLTTIRSRCRTIRFAPLPKEEIAKHLESTGIPSEEALTRAQLSGGSLKKALEKSDPLREQILDILAQPKWRSWNELTQAVESIHEGIEKDQKELREELAKDDSEWTAYQKQVFEKEMDGTVMMHLITQANTLFTAILAWYRDLELIRAKGDLELLIHWDRYNDLATAHQRGERLALTVVEKYINDARTALDRSTPLTHTLESLFLKLERL